MRRLPIGIRLVPVLLALIGISMAGAPSALALTAAPPPWWSEGRALIEKRGGTCENSSMTDMFSTQVKLVCTHRIPMAVVKRGTEYCFAYESSPTSFSIEGALIGGAPPPKGELIFECRIYANPGTESRPNTASWECTRFNRPPPYWQSFRTPRTPIFPDRQAATLAGCLAPRAALDEPTTPASQARGKGVKLPVTCSHTCKVAVTGGARRVRTTLRAGKRTVLRIPLRGAVARLRVSVSAAGYRSSATVRARTRGATVRIDAPDTLSLKR